MSFPAAYPNSPFPIPSMLNLPLSSNDSNVISFERR